jgi:hypothetical protein
MRYKLKQTYYGSPKEGTIVVLKNTIKDEMPYYEGKGYSYSTDEVENYPHLWEKLEDEYPTYGCVEAKDLHYTTEFMILQKLIALRDIWWIKDGWQPDFDNSNQDRYCVYLYQRGKWEISIINAPELFVFKDEATAEKFLEQNREYLEQLKSIYYGL